MRVTTALHWACKKVSCSFKYILMIQKSAHLLFICQRESVYAFEDINTRWITNSNLYQGALVCSRWAGTWTRGWGRSFVLIKLSPNQVAICRGRISLIFDSPPAHYEILFGEFSAQTHPVGAIFVFTFEHKFWLKIFLGDVSISIRKIGYDVFGRLIILFSLFTSERVHLLAVPYSLNGFWLPRVKQFPFENFIINVYRLT